MRKASNVGKISSIKRRATGLLAQALVVSLCTGCDAWFFTDAVERDKPTPRTTAAVSVWSACLTDHIEVAARDPRRLGADEVTPAIRDACHVAREAAIQAAHGEQSEGRIYGELRGDQPLPIAARVQLSRALAAGMHGVDPGPAGAGAHVTVSQAEFDSRLQRWDACADAAAVFFARANPHDVPIQLAQGAIDYCWRFGWYAKAATTSNLSTAEDRKAQAESVSRHEVARRPELAVLIGRLQAEV